MPKRDGVFERVANDILMWKWDKRWLTVENQK